MKIDDLRAQNKLLESGRDEFKKLYDLEVKKNNEKKNEIQELLNLKIQKTITLKEIPSIKPYNRPSNLQSNLNTGNIYKKIDKIIDDKKQNERSINPATKGFLIEIHKYRD